MKLPRIFLKRSLLRQTSTAKNIDPVNEILLLCQNTFSLAGKLLGIFTTRDDVLSENWQNYHTSYVFVNRWISRKTAILLFFNHRHSSKSAMVAVVTRSDGSMFVQSNLYATLQFNKQLNAYCVWKITFNIALHLAKFIKGLYFETQWHCNCGSCWVGLFKSV